MKLNSHKKEIKDVDGWRKHCPPKEEKQWKEGRSAQCLAEYMTKNFPQMPQEIESALSPLVASDAAFDWDAEYVTPLPGTGEGRNHDAILFHDDLLVTIEAKVDEPLGKKIQEEMADASVNKLHRISTTLNYLFKGAYKKYGELRYQLLTASVGTLLEAQKKSLKEAVMLVLVFETNGKVKTPENLAKNHADIVRFLGAVEAYDEGCFKVIPNNSGIKLYFKEIII